MSWQGPLKKIDDFRFEIDPDYQSEAMKRAGVRMRVPGLIYTSQKMLADITRDNSPDQVANVATLPGIVGKSMAMPDIHHGYGFSIGGVAAFDAEHGIISPGGVGYDINCGVRLLRSNLKLNEITKQIPALIDTIFDKVPCGVGATGSLRLNEHDLIEVLTEGARWVVRQGYGKDADLEFTETNGGFENHDPTMVSQVACKRGRPQLGTLGAGNHFVEIQRVDAIYDKEAAEVFGISEVDQVLVMIHTGSRGLGHQICDDYLRLFKKIREKYDIRLADKQLACAPGNSPEGRQYFSAMMGGANFAWANRQVIAHQVRAAFKNTLGLSSEQLGLNQIYDIAHNIARLEEHTVDGIPRKLFVHRKGATRASGPGHEELPEKYRAIGQPVIIPGSMGSASYLLVGTQGAMDETFGSSCHGAGRVKSRHEAVRTQTPQSVIDELNEKKISLRAKTRRVISEEAPAAYKNIDEVVDVSHNSGLARKVVRLCPLGVVKG